MYAAGRTSGFDRALRAIAVPALAAHGFRFDGSRTFRRLSEDGNASRIIQFQLGQRGMAGRFTVNLGVFAAGDSPGVTPDRAQAHHCHFARRMRIGMLIPVRFPALARVPGLGVLFGPRDTWWSFGEDAARTAKAVTACIDRIDAHGLGWLEANAP